MRILLDTHVFLWAILDDERYSGPMRDAMCDGQNELYLSVASIWEILIKSSLGKLPLPKPTATFIAGEMFKNRIRQLGIQAQHLASLENLPLLHKDPFDRMIVAQAKSDRLTIATADTSFDAYGVQLLGPDEAHPKI